MKPYSTDITVAAMGSHAVLLTLTEPPLKEISQQQLRPIDLKLLLQLLPAEYQAVIQDVVPAACTVLIQFVPSKPVPADFIDQVLALTTQTVDRTALQVSTIEIPVHYHGPDLADMAELKNLSTEAFVKWHTQTPWECQFGGFAPGFMYLTREADNNFPRHDTPRPRLEPGSVGLAGNFSGIYPQASPGGWQIIGTTTAALWDLNREQPSLIVPGDLVQFVEVN